MKNKNSVGIVLALIMVLSIGLVESARLPTINGDSGSWGGVLNDYLNISLSNDGYIKNGSIMSYQLNLTHIGLADFIDNVGYQLEATAFKTENESNPTNATIQIGTAQVTGLGDFIIANEQNPTNTTISITESQISDLVHTVDTNTQLTQAQVNAFEVNPTNSTIEITESQISNLQSYLLVEQNPSNETIEITQSQISDFGSYITTSGNLQTIGGNLLIKGNRVANTGYEQFLKIEALLNATGTASSNAKTWMFQIDGERPANFGVGNGDWDDTGIKLGMANYADNNSAGYIMRGLDVAVKNRDGGSVTTLSGGHISATQKASSPTTNLYGMTIKVESDSANTAPTNVMGLDVEYDMVAPTGVPTISAGVRVNQNSDFYSAYPLAGFMVDNGASNRDWQFGLYIDDDSINKADIRLSSSASAPSTCDSTTEGGIYYNSVEGNFYGCADEDGTGAGTTYTWEALN